MTHLIRRACYNTIWFEVFFLLLPRMCIECKCTKKFFINDIYAHIMVGWFTIYLLATFSPSSVTPHYPITIGNTIIDPQKLCKPTSPCACWLHTVREWIYNRHKLPRTFDSSLSIYDINAYKKCLEKLIWTKKKNHVPQGGIEPAPSLIRSGLARIKWKMSSMLSTELWKHW